MPLTDDPWLVYNADGSVSPYMLAIPVSVYRFDGVSSLTLLPNVECLSITQSEGTDPGSAVFRYNLAFGIGNAPDSIETALATGIGGGYVVSVDDRLVVQAVRPDGTPVCLFDGLAVDFGMGLDPSNEDVQLGAIGIGSTAFDTVIGEAIFRDAAVPMGLLDTQTDLLAQFNPGGLPNCSPDGFMAGSVANGLDFRYPTFLDPQVIHTPDSRTYWTLAKACRYILFNPTGNPSQQYVNNPDGAYLDGLLVTQFYGNPPTNAIRCPDTPISGKDWPGTINRLVGECGFGTNFSLTTSAGLPTTTFNVFDNQAGAVKSLYLAPRGTDFDPTLFNFNMSNLHRDVSEVVNQQTLVGGPNLWEASFILAPGFPMVAADSSDATLPTFEEGDPSFITTNGNKYRLYIFDETGDGTYAPGSNALAQTVPSLDGLFGKGQYTSRRRPGIGTLISVDLATNRTREARLSISTNYAGTSPGLWDGTGTWQTVDGGWRLAPDRLGIIITARNPNSWNIGESSVAGVPFPGGVVNGVEAQAVTGATNFTLRLTCVVEADQALVAVATPSGNSPVSRTISRTTDASDRYHNEYVDYPSEFNATGGNDLNPRNDQPAALAEMQALRAQTESGVLSGQVVIPRLTAYYQIGDRIDSIQGRNLGLRTDAGTGNPVYPVVVGVSYQLDGNQTTTLDLSDAGTKRLRYRRPPGRRRIPASEVLANREPDRGTVPSPVTGYEPQYMKGNPANAGGFTPKPGQGETP